MLDDLRLDHVGQILVLNRNHIGDCLLTTPLLRSLKRRFPHAHIGVSVPAANQDLLTKNAHVDEIVVRPRLSHWGAKVSFALQMRERGYDLIISLQEKSLFYAWAAFYAAMGSRALTVNLDHPRTRFFYRHSIRPSRPGQHEVQRYLDVARYLGCPVDQNPVLELQPAPHHNEGAARLLQQCGAEEETRFIGINPGATRGEKRWPVERFAQAADRLYEQLGLPAMIFGGSGDRGLALAIESRITTHRPVSIAGRASLGESAALMGRCRLLVTNDTGPMHMAVALAVPVVALFGPTNPVKFSPFTRQKAVLSHPEPCGVCTRPCTHTISVDECVDAALGLYQAPPAPRLSRQRSRAGD